MREQIHPCNSIQTTKKLTIFCLESVEVAHALGVNLFYCSARQHPDNTQERPFQDCKLSLMLSTSSNLNDCFLAFFTFQDTNN